MTEVLESIEQAPLVIHPIPSHRMDDDQFFEFCQLNRDLRIERSAEGNIIVMAPAGGSSGRNNAALTAQFWNWAKKDGREVSSILPLALYCRIAPSALRTCRGF